MSRVHNFSAGPAALPLDVLEIIRNDIPDWQGTGMSVMEISHRSKEFIELAARCEANLRQLLSIPDGYSVLWTQGGATLQMALTVKQRDEQILLVDDLSIEAPKTKLVVEMLAGLGLEGRVLIYDVEANEGLARAARNIPGVSVVQGFGLSVYDLLLHDWLLTTTAGIERISEALK